MQAGETLFDIAQKEAIRLETLAEYNLLRKDMQPAAGEQLNLHTKSASMPGLALKEKYSSSPTSSGVMAMNTSITNSAKSGTASSVHSTGKSFINCRVQPKETVYSIARRYNVKIEDIVKWNQLNGYDLRQGQQLKIYK